MSTKKKKKKRVKRPSAPPPTAKRFVFTKRVVALLSGGVLLLGLLSWWMIVPDGFLFGAFAPSPVSEQPDVSPSPSPAASPSPVIEGEIPRTEVSYYYYRLRDQLLQDSQNQGVELTEDDYGENLIDQAKREIEKDRLLASQAEAAGVQVSVEGQALIEENLTAARQEAGNAEVELDTLLASRFGEGMTEELYIDLLLRIQLAREWSDTVVSGYEISESDAQTYYNEHKDEIDVIDYYCVYFVADITEEMTQEEMDAAFEDAQAAAEAFENTLNPAVSFESLEPAFPDMFGEKQTLADAKKNNRPLDSFSQEDVYEWLSDAGRRTGDYAVFAAEDKRSVSVFSFIERRRPDRNPVSFRNVLIFSELEGQDREVTQPQAKQYAQDLHNTWITEGGEEEAFDQMARVESGDTASRDLGGLYEDVGFGTLSPGVLSDWIFDDARAPGDSVVLEEEIGFYILYFVGKNALPEWHYQADQRLRNERYQEEMEQAREDFGLDTSYIESNYVLACTTL